MSLDNFKDDIDIMSSSSSSSSNSESQSTRKSSRSSSRDSIEGSSASSSFPTPHRPHRTEQIERIQGVWWTSEERDQLVEIRSSYAIFDALQQSYVSTTSPMPPAVAYPLGGTDDIVTLRTFKLAVPHENNDDDGDDGEGIEVPQWISSPTSKVSVHRGGGTAIGTESPSIQAVTPTPSTSFLWERCTNPDECWKSDRVIQGYEQSLTTLLASEGPHWSASPVDVLRACLKGVRDDDYDLVDSLCRFLDDSQQASTSGVNIGRKNSNSEALLSISYAFEKGASSWSIIKCHYFSPDVCTLKVSIGSACDENETKTFEFCLSRERKKPRRASDHDDDDYDDNKMPASHLFNSIMDVELLVNGKTWAVDHIHACTC